MSDVTLVGNISSAVTTLTVNQDFQPVPGDKFLIDDEIIEFGGHPPVPPPWGRSRGTVIAVERGVVGSVAASHSSGAVLTPVLPAYSSATPPIGGSGSTEVADAFSPDALWVAGARVAAPKAMPVPPTIANSVAYESSIPDAVTTLTISGGVINTLFRFSGADVHQFGPSFPDSEFVGTTALPYSYRTEFTVDSDVFEIWTKANGGNYRIRVDGQPATLAPKAARPATGDWYFIVVTFPTAQVRAIMIETTVPIGGILVGPSFSVSAPTSPARDTRLVILGDSYTEGTGALGGYTGYAHAFGDLMGWDTWASGLGGTGYLWTGGGVKFRDRVAADVIAHSPDVVIVAGGINDFANFTGSQIEAEADLLFAAIQSGLPSARLIVLSPWKPRADAWGTEFDACVTALRNAADTAGVQYIDTATVPWLDGTGHFGALAGDGVSDYFISNDTTHPTQSGHDYLAYRLSGSIGS